MSALPPLNPDLLRILQQPPAAMASSLALAIAMEPLPHSPLARLRPPSLPAPAVAEAARRRQRRLGSQK